MVDGKGDVAFFKHGTVEKAIKKGHYGNQTDYEYLCRDGSRKGETWHLICTCSNTLRWACITEKRSLPPLVCYKKQSHTKNKNVCDKKEMLRAETPAQQLRKSHPAIQGGMTYIRNHRRPAWGGRDSWGVWVEVWRLPRPSNPDYLRQNCLFCFPGQFKTTDLVLWPWFVLFCIQN